MKMDNMFRKFLYFIVFSVFLLSDAPADNDLSAVETVQVLQQAIIQNMKDNSGNTDRIRQTVLATHQLDNICRLAVGRFWKDWSDEQRKSLLDAFTDYTVNTYAARFSSYSDETFQVIEDMPFGETRHRVISELTTADGSIHQFDFQLEHNGRHWKIVNILVDGVSDLALKRAEYTRLIQESGHSGLLLYLQQQSAELSSESQ